MPGSEGRSPASPRAARTGVTPAGVNPLAAAGSNRPGGGQGAGRAAAELAQQVTGIFLVDLGRGQVGSPSPVIVEPGSAKATRKARMPLDIRVFTMPTASPSRSAISAAVRPSSMIRRSTSA